MSVYLIVYNQMVHDHMATFKVSAKVKSFGTWANFMPGSYLVETEMNSVQMKEEIEKVIASEDFAFITKIDKDNAGCVHPGALAWIAERV
ncbi:MAG: hypothetical protein RR620_03665 [Clostridium sp.]